MGRASRFVLLSLCILYLQFVWLISSTRAGIAFAASEAIKAYPAAIKDLRGQHSYEPIDALSTYNANEKNGFVQFEANQAGYSGVFIFQYVVACLHMCILIRNKGIIQSLPYLKSNSHSISSAKVCLCAPPSIAVLTKCAGYAFDICLFPYDGLGCQTWQWIGNIDSPDYESWTYVIFLNILLL